ncbi:MAG: hypothetical protein STSR0009_18370 [Methanoregula sp.]
MLIEPRIAKSGYIIFVPPKELVTGSTTPQITTKEIAVPYRSKDRTGRHTIAWRGHEFLDTGSIDIDQFYDRYVQDKYIPP